MFVALALTGLLVVSNGAPRLPAETPIPSLQGKKELRRQLAARVAGIDPKDGDALYAAALWAKRKGLDLDFKRILHKVLKADPDHEEARKALGYVKWKDKWFKKERFEAEKKKAEEAEYRRKGYVKHDGVWVKKEDLEFLKMGLLRYEGKWVRRPDYLKYKEGLVPHPDTGVWIKKEDLERAESGKFPVQGSWVTKEEANKAHSTWERPWVVQTENIRIVTTAPLDKAKEWANDGETQITIIKNLLYPPGLPLPRRVTIFGFLDQAAYQDFGAQYDDTGFSAYGAFRAAGQDGAPIAAYLGEKNWGPYYLKHAAGLGVAHMLLVDDKLSRTNWIYTAFGAYLERWSNRASAQHFGRQYLAKGGIRNLKSFFKNFAISPDQSSQETDWNIYQAGIMLSYLQKEEDKKLRKAWEKVRTAVRKRKGIRKVLQGMEKVLVKREQELRDHLGKLVRGGR